MLSILIVNWNTRDDLRACLASLRATCSDLSHEVIVVDNASDDGSSDMVRAEFPTATLLALDENTGYAAGNNRAYEAAQGEFVWLLNPDTVVLPDAARTLLDFLEAHPRCGAVASLLEDARTGQPQQSCRRFPSPRALWCEATGLARFFPRSRFLNGYRYGEWHHRTTRRVAQPMASSLLLRRSAIEASGGLFDLQFPIFFNDVDLCWRIIHRGWHIWYCADARVRHKGGAGTSQRRRAMIAESHRSLLAFYRQYYRARLSPLVYAATVLLVRASGWWRVRRAS